MAKSDEDNIDAILKSIREAIIDKEQRKYFEQFRTENQKKNLFFLLRRKNRTKFLNCLRI